MERYENWPATCHARLMMSNRIHLSNVICRDLEYDETLQTYECIYWQMELKDSTRCMFCKFHWQKVWEKNLEMGRKVENEQNPYV